MKKITEKCNCCLQTLTNGEYSARELVLSGVVLFLFGMIVGMLVSPRKNQMFGSYNGSYNGNEDYGYDFDEDEE